MILYRENMTLGVIMAADNVLQRANRHPCWRIMGTVLFLMGSVCLFVPLVVLLSNYFPSAATPRVHSEVTIIPDQDWSDIPVHILAITPLEKTSVSVVIVRSTDPWLNTLAGNYQIIASAEFAKRLYVNAVVRLSFKATYLQQPPGYVQLEIINVAPSY